MAEIALSAKNQAPFCHCSKLQSTQGLGIDKPPSTSYTMPCPYRKRIRSWLHMSSKSHKVHKPLASSNSDLHFHAPLLMSVVKKGCLHHDCQWSRCERSRFRSTLEPIFARYLAYTVFSTAQEQLASLTASFLQRSSPGTNRAYDLWKASLTNQTQRTIRLYRKKMVYIIVTQLYGRQRLSSLAGKALPDCSLERIMRKNRIRWLTCPLHYFMQICS